NGSRQRHSSPSSLASGSSTDETGPPHRIPDSPPGHDPSTTVRFGAKHRDHMLSQRSYGGTPSRGHL
ncbi:hypothetical protein CN088_34110, partial [Sinorhizobium meliloti]